VTKCPPQLSVGEQFKIQSRLQLKMHQQLFFSTIDYDTEVYSGNETKPVSEIRNREKVLLAGIARPKPFFEYLKNGNDVILEFPDHHHFSDAEIANLKTTARNRLIVTTEKDYVRLKNTIPSKQLFYLPIQSKLLSDSLAFDRSIVDYVASHI
jgi:tetraacyldisaccharide 4'-kinase